MQLETLQFSWGSSDASGQFPAIRSVPRIGSPQALPAGLQILLLLHTHTEGVLLPSFEAAARDRHRALSVITSPMQLLVPQFLCL